jgi:hypothetical protein
MAAPRGRAKAAAWVLCVLIGPLCVRGAAAAAGGPAAGGPRRALRGDPPTAAPPPSPPHDQQQHTQLQGKPQQQPQDQQQPQPPAQSPEQPGSQAAGGPPSVQPVPRYQDLGPVSAALAGGLADAPLSPPPASLRATPVSGPDAAGPPSPEQPWRLRQPLAPHIYLLSFALLIGSLITLLSCHCIRMCRLAQRMAPGSFAALEGRLPIAHPQRPPQPQAAAARGTPQDVLAALPVVTYAAARQKRGTGGGDRSGGGSDAAGAAAGSEAGSDGEPCAVCFEDFCANDSCKQLPCGERLQWRWLRVPTRAHTRGCLSYAGVASCRTQIRIRTGH